MTTGDRKSPRRKLPNAYARTRSDHQTEIAEDYVELINLLIEETGEARAVDIAHRLSVSHVTVTKTLKRLKDGGLVNTRPYRAIFLTDKGRELALKVTNRHHAVESFLLAIGVPRDIACVDAEGIEHHVSETTLAAMRKFSQRGK